MYIKKQNKNRIEIINVNIDSYKQWYVEDNKIIFSKGTDKDTLSFTSQEEAESARDRIFERLSYKAPMGNILDLTVSEDMSANEEAEDVENEQISYNVEKGE